MQQPNTHILKQLFAAGFLIIIALINHVFVLPKIAVAISYVAFVIYFIFETKYKCFLTFILPLICTLCVGFVFSFSHDSRDVYRDIYYFTNPILFLILGTIYAINVELERFILFIVKLGILLSAIYIAQALILFGLNFWGSLYQIRSTIGVGNSFSVLSLIILMFSKKYPELSLVYSLRFRRLYIIVNLIAIVLFGSRTYLGVLIITILVLLVPFLKQHFLKYVLIGTIGIVGAILLINSLKGNFVIDKLTTSITEISSTKDIDSKDIYVNYRGYETQCATDTYLQGSPLQHVMGRGFGQLIDLKMYIALAGDDWRYIPVLHNGFLYLLVKTGILGCILFLLFFVKVFNLSRYTYHQQNKFLSVFSIAILLSICFTTSIVSGFFNIEFELLLITLGALIQYMLLGKITPDSQ